MPHFTPNELVWYEEGGQIHSAGYKVESLFKTLGIAPMSTSNEPMSGGSSGDGRDGEQFSDFFRFMGVPAGLSSIISENVVEDNAVMTGGRRTTNSKHNDKFDIQRTEKGLIPSSLFDKLTELAGPDNDGDERGNGSKSKRGNTKGKNQITRRQRVKEASKSGKKRTTRRNRRG